jgi:YHS domain-containing protein
MESLAERLHNRLEQHRHDLADKQQQIDSIMKELLDQREKLTAIAKRKIDTIILPRMEELARLFDNAQVKVLHTDQNFSCVCEFVHTPRFPATVQLSIALLPGNNENLTVRYDLSILPVLMAYDRNFEGTFPFEDSEEALAHWVDDRIVDFVDTYLRLESHPLYQKDNIVVDIVCGMRIPLSTATSSVERHGRTFYFCSEHCKKVYVTGVA